MRSRPPSNADSDGGFTLVELLIVVVLSGILMPAIVAVFTSIVRNSPAVQIRADDSRAIRGLSTYLPQDLLSTPPTIVTDGSSTPGYTLDPARASDCPGAVGTNVVHMAWQENAGTLITYVANYRYVVTGTSAQITRYTCARTGSGAFVTTRKNPVTTPIINASSVSANRIPSSGPLQFIEVKVQTTSGAEVLIRAASRNPAEQLPTP